MTRRLPPTDRTDRSPAVGGPSRRSTSPLAAVTDVAATFAGFFLFTAAASLLAPHVPPLVSLLGLWFVGLPAAFALSALGVRVGARLRRRLRRFACAHWRTGCDPDCVESAA